MALTGQIVVSTDQLRNQSTIVKSELDRMQTHFERISGLINGSANYWIGEGGDAQRKQFTGKISTIEVMINRYREHIRDLETMAGVYEVGEKIAANAADSLPASVLD